jgi:hypothetical protein
VIKKCEAMGRPGVLVPAQSSVPAQGALSCKRSLIAASDR